MPSKVKRSQTCGTKDVNLKISNLPQRLNDMAIISGFKQLIHPISRQTYFKKMIFKRTLSGKAFIFMKFAKQDHMNAAYAQIRNKCMDGHKLSVQFADDDHLRRVTKSLSKSRSSTLHRSGFMVQYLQNGSERMTTIVPTNECTHSHAPKKATPHHILLLRNKYPKTKTIIKKPRKIQIKPTKHKHHKVPCYSMASMQAVENLDRGRIKRRSVAANIFNINTVKQSADYKTQTNSDGNSSGSHCMQHELEVTLYPEASGADGDSGVNADVGEIGCSAKKQSDDVAHDVVKNDMKARRDVLNAAVDTEQVPVIKRVDHNERNLTIKARPKCKLLIENIQPHVSERQLKNKFDPFGTVSSVKIVRDPETSASKGIAFVSFTSLKASIRAIKSMHDTSWYGQTIRVSCVSDQNLEGLMVKWHQFEGELGHDDTDTSKAKRTGASTKIVKKPRIIATDPRKSQSKVFVPPIRSSVSLSPPAIEVHDVHPALLPPHLEHARNTTFADNTHAITNGRILSQEAQASPINTQDLLHQDIPKSIATTPYTQSIDWSYGLLLGKLPDFPPNAYHKLRFKIEQCIEKPITAIQALEKPIASLCKASDLFTWCVMLDSATEIVMKDACAKLKVCSIMNNVIICDMASKYIQQLNAMFDIEVPEIHNTAAAESDIRMKSMSMSASRSSSPMEPASFSPSTKSNTTDESNTTGSISQSETDSVHFAKQNLVKYPDRYKGEHAKYRRNSSRSRSRYRSYKEYLYHEKMKRYESYDRSRSRSRKRYNGDRHKYQERYTRYHNHRDEHRHDMFIKKRSNRHRSESRSKSRWR